MRNFKKTESILGDAWVYLFGDKKEKYYYVNTEKNPEI